MKEEVRPCLQRYCPSVGHEAQRFRSGVRWRAPDREWSEFL